MRFLGLSRETVSCTSSGKFLRVESCYPENFGFLCLCLGDVGGGGDVDVVYTIYDEFNKCKHG